MSREPTPFQWGGSLSPSGANSFASQKPHLPRWGLYAFLAVLTAGVLIEIPTYLQKWLWMRQLNYLDIFWTLLFVQWAMFFFCFIFTFLFFWSNVRQAVRNSYLLYDQPAAVDVGGPWQRPSLDSRDLWRTPIWVKPAVIASSAIVAWVFALAFSANWDTYLRFHYGGSYGLRDPLFGVDVGFYVFHLPFYELEQHGLVYLSFVTLVVVIAIYVIAGLLQVSSSRALDTNKNATRHLSALLIVPAATMGWGFYLDRYGLVFSTLGVVYGAGYAADHVTRLALWVMLGASVAACVLLALNLFRPSMKAIVVGAVAYVTLYFLSVLLLPHVFQDYVVQPNELALEMPYLKRYIAFTRTAYGLDAIDEMSYPALAGITQADVARNQDTINNIRLWDSRPLLQTYRQTQAIRLYYNFYNVDTDRYHLSDGYHQVMLSTRELSEQLPLKAQTWVNEHLQFTHGYGIVMNFVSTTATDGIPQYILDNIPTQPDYGLSIAQPSIYYGKSMPGYRIVGTGVKEFDYPKGNDNVYTSYAGKGGIPLDSLWKRMLFAWTQHDVNILLTSYVKPETRIQIWRRVRERVAKIAPFLRLDHDPYAVLSDGKLYWIQDAYTVSNYFPYSNPLDTIQQGNQLEPGFEASPPAGMSQLGTATADVPAGFTGSLNYIRNSVKVVVDMYDGTVRFYVMDPADPILAVYRRAFPSAFSGLGQLSNDLKSHLRYPEDLFAIQAEQYKLFHMTDPQVFYNQEDLWQFPREKYERETHFMRPYYVLMKLPGSSKLEYLLMTPFTPPGRGNMISWMAAECDAPNYGKMVDFRLPKEKLIYGPEQIEAMIDQNTDISRQITLWDQRGSRVIRGKQIVTPIENSFLYVVPLYLTAADIPFPQLKRVIVAADGKVAMAPTLDAALADLFMSQQLATGTPQASRTTAEGGSKQAFEQARRSLDQARQALQKGNWEQFGAAMDALEHQLSAATN
jgi:uncharacterized protein